MKTYLKLEGKHGPKPRPQPQTHLQQTQLQPTKPQPSNNAPPKNNNTMTRKAPGPKTSDKGKRTMLTKRSYKVRVLTQPIPTTTTPTAPTPTGSTTSTQTSVDRSAAASIQVMVYKLAMGKFAQVPYPTARPRMKDILLFEAPTLHHWKT